METIRDRVSGLLLSNKRHAKYIGILACLAVVVAFGTALVLRQNGRALTHEETVLDCHYSGNGAHTHSASCYDADGKLVCPLQEKELHTHTDECYTTNLVCGMEEGQELEDGTVHTHTDACYETVLTCGKEEVTEEHVHGDGCFQKVTVTEEAEEPAMPAQDFKQNLKERDNKGVEHVVLTVSVKAPEGALPKDAELRVSGVASQDIEAMEAKVEAVVKKTSGDDYKVKQYQAVDIKFYDKDGKQIEPKKDVEVKITSSKVDEIEKPILIHVIDKTRESAKGKTVDAELVSKAAIVNFDDNDKSTGHEDTFKFKSSEFSPYVIVEAEKVVEDEAEPAVEDEAEAAVEDEADEGITMEYLSSDGATYNVTVAMADGSTFPEGYSLKVTELGETSIKYLSAFVAVAGQEKVENPEFDPNTLGMAALDITILDADGNEWEPEGQVNMSVEVKELPKKYMALGIGGTLKLQHLNTSTGKTVVETLATDADGSITISDNTAEAYVTLDSFSTFTLTWGENDEYATIHFGKYVSGSYSEFDETLINFDTTAQSFSIANNFDEEGYLYTGAVYCAPEKGIDEGVEMDSVIHKTANGWEFTKLTKDEHGEVISTERIAIEDGSNIYATYTKPSQANPSGSSNPAVPNPTAKKKITKNADGTYTIQLDITGATVEETNAHYANVLIVLDATRSMNGSKWTNAKAAMKALIETLTEGSNSGNAGKIDFALVTFGRSATVVQGWTKDNVEFKSTCADVDMVTSSGTNWEAGMRGALYGVLNSWPEGESADSHDPTYVIFLTDGDPNVYYSSGDDENYSNTGTTNGWSQPAGTSASKSADEAEKIAKKTLLYGIYCGSDSVPSPEDESYNRLVGVIQGEGQGGIDTIAASAETIESEFKKIAETIVSELGTSNVSVDDGIPSLSSVSAQVEGSAGAFKYYTSTDGTNYTTWADAPGASYSNDNGVTWDLSEVETVDASSHYRLEFTVWPSQEALDLIANLNNGTVTMTDAELAKLNIKKVGNSYTLATNTHLNMSYTFKDQTYTDQVTPLVSADMTLDTDEMNVMKAWEDSINTRNRADGVEFYLLVDGKYYWKDGTLNDAKPSDAKYYPLEAKAEDWKDSIYIAPGVTASGKILETGHLYKLEEKAAYKLNTDGTKNYAAYQNYSMDFASQTVRPMVIDGVDTYLVMIDANNPAPSGAQTYTLDDSKGTIVKGGNNPNYYAIPSTSTAGVTGTNYKTPELDITKAISANSKTDKTAAELDEETFTYTVTFTFPAGSDPSGVGYWVYKPSTAEKAWTLPEYDGEANYIPDNYTAGQKFYAESSTPIFDTAPSTTSAVTKEVTVTLTRSDVIRFTNLPVGTTYTIVESKANGSSLASEGYAVEKINAGYMRGYSATTNITTNSAATVSTQTATVSGTISTANTRYHHRFTNVLKAVDVYLKGTKKLDGYEWGGETYHFTLAAGANTNPMPTEATGGKTEFDLTAASGSADQTDSFGRIRFTAAGEYTYTVSETNAGTVQVVNGKPITFGEAKTVKIVVKEDNDGKLVVDSVDGATWDESTSTATATITNTYEKLSVDATKEWQDASGTKMTTAPDDAEVTFTLFADGEETDLSVDLDGTVDENGEATAWVASFKDLPKYKVEDGKASEIKYTVKETKTFSGYDLITTGGVASGGIIINRQGTWYVQFKKTDMSSNGLPGAVFNFSEGKRTLTSGSDGILANGDTKVFELAITDVAYTLSEDTAPGGYLRLTDDVYVYVGSTSVTATLGNGEGATNYTVSGSGSKEDPFVVTITNSNGTEFPNTGGIGTTLFTIIGTAIAVAAVLTYGLLSRRESGRRSQV